MDSDDEGLKRAIALSLEQDGGGSNKIPRGSDIVDLTEDDGVWPGFVDSDEMDYYKAVAISMGEGTIMVELADDSSLNGSMQKVQKPGSKGNRTSFGTD